MGSRVPVIDQNSARDSEGRCISMSMGATESLVLVISSRARLTVGRGDFGRSSHAADEVKTATVIITVTAVLALFMDAFIVLSFRYMPPNQNVNASWRPGALLGPYSLGARLNAALVRRSFCSLTVPCTFARS